MISIFVIEELGKAYWRWEYPGTVVELLHDWKTCRAPSWYGCAQNYRGNLVQLHTEQERLETIQAARGRAYLFTSDLTYLVIDGVRYDVPAIGSAG
jgi:hypothetical protein